jgi:SWI/SNF-related matrix-associated actin-dependent regulator 1 of chromatin subfamily A
MQPLSHTEYNVLKEALGGFVTPVGKTQYGKDLYLKIEYKDDHVYIYNSFNIKDLLKSYGFSFVPENKSWKGTNYQFITVANKIWKYLSVEDRIRCYKLGVKNQYIDKAIELLKKRGIDTTDDEVKKTIELYKDLLYPHQLQGIQAITKAYKNGMKGFILGDEQGLGKTIQAIAFIYTVYDPEKYYIYITKKSLIENVRHEFFKFDLGGFFYKKVSKLPKQGHICITSYNQIIAKKMGNYYDGDYHVVVCDEAHLLKNINSKTYKTFEKNIRSNFYVFMTGTIIKNRPAEAYTITKMLGMHNMSLYKFVKTYEGDSSYITKDRRNARYYERIDLDAVERFKQNLLNNNIYLRRTKKDVLSFLPGKERIMVEVTFSDENTAEIREALDFESKVVDILYKKKGLPKEIAERISYYRRIIGVHKVDFIVNYILEKLLHLNRLIIFAHHNDVINALNRQLTDSISDLDLRVIYGSTRDTDREKALIAFKSDSTDKIWLLGSLATISEGLNLTNANNAVFAEFDWSPAVIRQAEDRIHRIGQKNTCYYYYIVVPSTLDEYIFRVIQKKETYISKIYD